MAPIEFEYIATPNVWTGDQPTPMTSPAGFLRLDEKTWKFATEGVEYNDDQGLLSKNASPSPASDAGLD